MPENQSHIQTIEKTVDDLADVKKRKPWLFYLIVLGLVAVGVLYVFDKFWGIPSLEEQITKQEKEIQELKRDRDSKATQLAPFLALANKTFEKSPPEKRLELLVERLDQVALNLETTVTQITRERGYGESEQTKIISALRPFRQWSVELGVVPGDFEAAQLASQLHGMFFEAGWKVSQISTIHGVAVKGFRVEFGNWPAPELQRALLPLWIDLGYPPSASTNLKLSATSIAILVGNK